MIASPVGTAVWIKVGVTDFGRSMNTLALALQQGLEYVGNGSDETGHLAAPNQASDRMPTAMLPALTR